MKSIILYEDEEVMNKAKIHECLVEIVFYDKGDHGALFPTDRVTIWRTDIEKIYKEIKNEQ